MSEQLLSRLRAALYLSPEATADDCLALVRRLMPRTGDYGNVLRGGVEISMYELNQARVPKHIVRERCDALAESLLAAHAAELRKRGAK